jgi:Putative cyclase
VTGHWAFQEKATFYNGVTKDDIEGPNKNSRNGIDRKQLCQFELIRPEWSKAGGIAGRGVLLDYVAYAQRHNIKYAVPGRHAITYKDLETMAREEKVEFRPGDVLLVRGGYVKWHNEASHEERLKGTAVHEYCGVEGSKGCIEWMWQHHFAAVASDTPAFETVPPTDEFYSASHKSRG